MKGVERARSIAHAHLDEVNATARIWRSYHKIIVGKSTILNNAFTEHRDKVLYAEALRDKETNEGALYRGLLVQVHGIFEGFVKNVIGGVLEIRRSEVSTYYELSEAIRHEHIVSTAKALQHIKTGTVQGVRFDFDKAIRNLGHCFTDSQDFSLEKDPFVILLGNCTPKKMEDVFRWMGVTLPFDDKLGENKLIKKWANETSKRKAAKAAKSALVEKIEQRNEIVHGNITKTITHTEFDQTMDFFYALTDGIAESITSSR